MRDGVGRCRIRAIESDLPQLPEIIPDPDRHGWRLQKPGVRDGEAEVPLPSGQSGEGETDVNRVRESSGIDRAISRGRERGECARGDADHGCVVVGGLHLTQVHRCDRVHAVGRSNPVELGTGKSAELGRHPGRCTSPQLLGSGKRALPGGRIGTSDDELPTGEGNENHRRSDEREAAGDTACSKHVVGVQASASGSLCEWGDARERQQAEEHQGDEGETRRHNGDGVDRGATSDNRRHWGTVELELPYRDGCSERHQHNDADAGGMLHSARPSRGIAAPTASCCPEGLGRERRCRDDDSGEGNDPQCRTEGGQRLAAAEDIQYADGDSGTEHDSE